MTARHHPEHLAHAPGANAPFATPAVHAAAGAGEAHEEHLPHGSIWPFFVAIGIALVGLGLVFLESFPVLVGAGLAFLVVMLIGWFREDFRFWEEHISTGRGMVRAGTLMFISSEVFIFGALFATYFTFQRAASHWPDSGIHLDIPLTALFSLFLFASSATIHQAENKIKAGDHRGFVVWWGLTILLGLVFLGGQVSEYITLIREGQGLTAGQFNTTFFMLTGTHGLHVFGGLCVLTVFWVRALKGQFTADRHQGPQAAAMYWHFVDLVWVFVFGILYIIPWLDGAFQGGHA